MINYREILQLGTLQYSQRTIESMVHWVVSIVFRKLICSLWK